MKQILLILSLLLSPYLIIGQTNLGVSMKGYQLSLSHLDEETSTNYGFSGAPYILKTTYGGAISSILRTNIHSNFELEYGLGYSYQNAQIHFDFIHPWSLLKVDRMMNINLHYCEIPILVNCKLFQSNNFNEFILSGGINSKILLSGEDNYNEIKFELIALGNPYKRLVIDGFISIGIRQIVKHNQYIELNLFTAMNLSQILRGGWGFYDDLSPAKISQLGINMKYFFLPIKI